MPRTPRVEYENAVYHVMARGDRREPIRRRELFCDTFAEACGRTGWQNHGIRRAGEIIGEGAAHYGMDEFELRKDRRGDWRRSSVAWAVARETSVPHAWIAEKLNLKSAANASQQISRFQQVPEKELPKEVRVWKLSRNVA
ncbi:MAG: hypothetical protein WD342_21330 [Verrucomicrobiales bacterium]